ncbi:hypothetical protein [Haloarchaeobius amylolyticus]|uniref:hypothetical protein n=1 Tax=Haloarchaeobius amylolyticus TaxID=1198296 RepID=UPI002271EDFE|nr:hypothetical protein [Haloarchaeobius amylolyticus]
MNRRNFLAAAATGLGTLAAGCLGGQETEGSPNTGETDSTDTTTETDTTTTDSADPTFVVERTTGDQVKVVHMGGATVTDEGTTSVAVTVDGQRVAVADDAGTEHAYFAADDSALGEDQTAATPYPISIGNRVFVTAPAGATVRVVVTDSAGETTVVAEKTFEGSAEGTGTDTATATTTGTASETETATGTGTTSGTQTTQN